MSYDLTLYRLARGAAAEDVAQMDAPGEGKRDRRPLLPWDKALRARMIAALKKLHPGFEGSGDELVDERAGIQIEVFEREASLAVPYWHKGADAKRVFALIWGCLKIMRDTAGAVVYDPQLDQVLDLDRDQNDVVRGYVQTVKAVGG